MSRKSKINVIVTLVIVSIGIASWLYVKELPRSFTLRAMGNFTSSAAQRDFKGNVVFLNNKVVSGVQSYSASGGTYDGTNKSWQTEYECVINNGQWIHLIDGKQCNKDMLGGGYIETTRQGIKSQIETGMLKSLNTCRHGDICYEISQ